jgi:VWFA-related protein
LALTLGAAAVVSPQAPVTIEPRQKSGAPSDTPRADLRVDTNEVLIPVAVNDEWGRPVAGLDPEHFRVFDDKEPQAISSFLMDNSPVALGLVFDTSGSMSRTLPQARRAATMFLTTANPGDQFMMVEFDSRPRLTVPLTDDLAHLRYELTFTQSKGSTALIDAVYMAMTEIKKSDRSRKALIVVSDGGDNNSRYSAGELKDLLQESQVLIYSVGVFSGDVYQDPGGPGLLRRIAEETGGRLFTAGGGLVDIAQKISIDLRNRYVLGYRPANPVRDGKYHRVEVELKPPRGLPKLKAYWRRGYYAPTD